LQVVRLVYPFSVRTTNNVAEWCALILGLAACKELGVRKLVCRGDSKLVINQV
jgi:ribonuclease HI